MPKFASPSEIMTLALDEVIGWFINMSCIRMKGSTSWKYIIHIRQSQQYGNVYLNTNIFHLIQNKHVT